MTSSTSTPTRRTTVGVLVAWQVYEGTTIGRYLHTLLRGVRAAAHDHGCNLLLSCGVGPPSRPGVITPAWPATTEDAQFVPVGPWNTDGLVVVPPLLTAGVRSYVYELRAAGHPLVFASAGADGPAVVIDNADGVRESVAHLVAHGHRRIAYLAGYPDGTGDSAERLAAYRAALAEHGLPSDEALIVFGEHNEERGAVAVTELLSRNAPFTALVASNDMSALGAMRALRDKGLRIPEDVALVGFDDIRDSRAVSPPLTTVRHPTFEMGYGAVKLLLDRLARRSGAPELVRVPARLVIRRSCGCGPDATVSSAGTPDAPEGLAAHVAAEVARESRHAPPELLVAQCSRMVDAFTEGVRLSNVAPFVAAMREALRRGEELDDDPHAWQAGISLLRGAALPALTEHERRHAELMLDHARVMVAERTRRQATRALVRQEMVTDQIGQMTAELLTTLDEAQIGPVLDAHLSAMGVQHLLAARYSGDEDEADTRSEPILVCGLAAPGPFLTRQFPPPHLYPSDEPYHLALLPLADEVSTGFLAVDADNLEPLGAIARNLAAALRSSRLYREAQEGRRLAEEASRLKSRFLSTVSHELRTPLNLIVGLSELLLHEGEEELSSALAVDLERIYGSAQHLGRLINDVLDMASSEANQLRVLREPLDLSDTLRVVALAGGQLAQTKGLAWSLHTPASGPWVLGDRTRLRQVVLNLVSNAVKFTEHGAVELRVEAVGGEAVISVHDTGLGITPEEQGRLFREFSRADRVAAGGYGGLGLGLAISQQLVALHEGALTVRSEGAGAGATFTVTLPAITPPPALQEYPVSRPVVAVSFRPGGADPLLAYLQSQGVPAEQLSAETPSWREQLLALRPAAVILDEPVAASDAWQLIGALKRLPESADTPVLVYRLDATGAGALYALDTDHKPLSLERLSALLVRAGRSSIAQGAPGTVLVVDDDPGIRDLHVRLVRQVAGHRQILTAVDGHAALKVMAEQTPELVLLDLMMPDLDGFGVLEAMRADERLREVPVVVLTAQSLGSGDLERLNRGVVGILNKGVFTGEDILAHLETALTGRRPESLATRQIVRRSIALIHARYAEALTREQIADAVGVSQNHLSDCFHQELRLAPITYLTRYRVMRARTLLEAGAQSITEVALAVGFSDSAYFSRVFQREVGVSPVAYRRGQRPQSRA